MPQAGLREKKKAPRKGASAALVLCAVAVLCALGVYLFQVWGQEGPTPSPPPLPTPVPTPTPPPPAGAPPGSEGANDMTVAVGMTISYRTGVTAVDAVDGKVKLEVDASAVNLGQPGEYPVTYRAMDKSGNRAETTVTVTVVQVSGVDDDDPTADVSGEGGQATVEPPPIREVTAEMVDQEADRILSKILSPSMTQWEQARAIYNYVHTHVKYVGSSDKSSWLLGAYVGFTRGRGDCYNYFACSKALLDRAGIPNVDLYRVGGDTDHYWQLVNVGTGWYHFDACPHPNSYPLTCFLLDEAAVRAYTEKCTPVRTNYYVYDYANCPVTAVGFPTDEQPVEIEAPAEGELPAESEPPSEVELPPEVQEPGNLLPNDVSATALPSELPTESQPPEPIPSPTGSGSEEVPAATPEPVPADPPAVEEGQPSPVPEIDPGTEEVQPSPVPEIDPSVEETPAEFLDISGKEETP